MVRASDFDSEDDWFDSGRARHTPEMLRAFEKFDRENPDVWRLFVRFALQAINAGRKTLSASLIFERIRWEAYVVTKSDDEFKLNNNYRAFYARKFMDKYSEHGGVFRTRASVADKK